MHFNMLAGRSALEGAVRPITWWCNTPFLPSQIMVAMQRTDLARAKQTFLLSNREQTPFLLVPYRSRFFLENGLIQGSKSLARIV